MNYQISSTPQAITFGEVKQWRAEVAHHLAHYNYAKAVKDARDLRAAQDRIAFSTKALLAIGDRLAVEMVIGCGSLDGLLNKWVDHRYRPTLRQRDGDIAVNMLADLYDWRAKQRGIDVVAYRG